MLDRLRPTPKEAPDGNGGSVIGFRDPTFNEAQYDKYAAVYLASNPEGTVGGLTPVERVTQLRESIPPGRTVLEVGSGGGNDAIELARAGYRVIASDISKGFLDVQTQRGLNPIRFDARKDPIPPGVDAIYANASFLHLSPKDLSGFLARAHAGLQNEKAIFFSVIEGRGHERSKRNRGFDRDFYYYPLERIVQMLDQEGFTIHAMEKIAAPNKTPWLHIRTTAIEKKTAHTFGELGYHPFGDVYWEVSNTLYDGNLLLDIAQDQVKAKLLSQDVLNTLRNRTWRYEQRKVPYSEYVDVVSRVWAKGLTGQKVADVRERARQLLDKNSSKFRKNIPAAFAVNNNNGFGNILNTDNPAWLMAIVSQQLNTDGYFGTSWETDTSDPDSASFTGEVTSPQDQINKERAIIERQRNLKETLGTGYRRITIGVSGSRNDVLAADYPILFLPDEKNVEYARQRGFFVDENRQNIYAEDVPWSRWPAFDDEDTLVRYLNVITSGRFPIRHYVTEHSRKQMGTFPLWMSEHNALNENIYKIGDNPLAAHIL